MELLFIHKFNELKKFVRLIALKSLCNVKKTVEAVKKVVDIATVTFNFSTVINVR